MAEIIKHLARIELTTQSYFFFLSRETKLQIITPTTTKCPGTLISKNIIGWNIPDVNFIWFKSVTKDRKLWRTINAYVLKGYSTSTLPRVKTMKLFDSIWYFLSLFSSFVSDIFFFLWILYCIFRNFFYPHLFFSLCRASFWFLKGIHIHISKSFFSVQSSWQKVREFRE